MYTLILIPPFSLSHTHTHTYLYIEGDIMDGIMTQNLTWINNLGNM